MSDSDAQIPTPEAPQVYGVFHIQVPRNMAGTHDLKMILKQDEALEHIQNFYPDEQIEKYLGTQSTKMRHTRLATISDITHIHIVGLDNSCWELSKLGIGLINTETLSMNNISLSGMTIHNLTDPKNEKFFPNLKTLILDSCPEVPVTFLRELAATFPDVKVQYILPLVDNYFVRITSLKDMALNSRYTVEILKGQNPVGSSPDIIGFDQIKEMVERLCNNSIADKALPVPPFLAKAFALLQVVKPLPVQVNTAEIPSASISSFPLINTHPAPEVPAERGLDVRESPPREMPKGSEPKPEVALKPAVGSIAYNPRTDGGEGFVVTVKPGDSVKTLGKTLVNTWINDDSRRSEITHINIIGDSSLLEFSLSGIEKFPNLEKLELNDVAIQSIDSSLAETKIQSLHLVNLLKLTDLFGIGSAEATHAQIPKTLRVLELTNCPGITSAEIIAFAHAFHESQRYGVGALNPHKLAINYSYVLDELGKNSAAIKFSSEKNLPFTVEVCSNGIPRTMTDLGTQNDVIIFLRQFARDAKIDLPEYILPVEQKKVDDSKKQAPAEAAKKSLATRLFEFVAAKKALARGDARVPENIARNCWSLTVSLINRIQLMENGFWDNLRTRVMTDSKEPVLLPLGRRLRTFIDKCKPEIRTLPVFRDKPVVIKAEDIVAGRAPAPISLMAAKAPRVPPLKKETVRIPLSLPAIPMLHTVGGYKKHFSIPKPLQYILGVGAAIAAIVIPITAFYKAATRSAPDEPRPERVKTPPALVVNKPDPAPVKAQEAKPEAKAKPKEEQKPEPKPQVTIAQQPEPKAQAPAGPAIPVNDNKPAAPEKMENNSAPGQENSDKIPKKRKTAAELIREKREREEAQQNVQQPSQIGR